MIERVLSVTLEVDDPVAFAPVTRISFDSKFSKFDSQQRLVLNPEIPKLFVPKSPSHFFLQAVHSKEDLILNSAFKNMTTSNLSDNEVSKEILNEVDLGVNIEVVNKLFGATSRMPNRIDVVGTELPDLRVL
ncbi:uncharacterized protein LOC126919567 [Bombus affinis]|uniref:uncharacterized protein LOC126919567 n=1 Tax=Bombus affinis TaxID=309941 RepID=UPI0021B72B18|nr:uncharacterized protein LOC126919567 [Bombus affinis]